MFQSGFTANAGTVAAILDKHDVIVSDRLNHASIIDGAQALPGRDQGVRAQGRRPRRRAARGDQGRRPPAAPDHRRRVLDGRGHRAAPRARRGRRAARRDHDDRRRARLRRARQRAARARSTTSACTGGWTSRSGTLSKAIGVLGGFIAGPHELIEWLQNRGRPFLFSTSAPPAAVAACIEALDIIADEPERLERLWSNTRTFKAGPARARVRHGRERDPDHAGDHRGRGADAGVRAPPVRGGRVLPGDRVPDGRARARRASGRS